MTAEEIQSFKNMDDDKKFTLGLKIEFIQSKITREEQEKIISEIFDYLFEATESVEQNNDTSNKNITNQVSDTNLA